MWFVSSSSSSSIYSYLFPFALNSFTLHQYNIQHKMMYISLHNIYEETKINNCKYSKLLIDFSKQY